MPETLVMPSQTEPLIDRYRRLLPNWYVIIRRVLESAIRNRQRIEAVSTDVAGVSASVETLEQVVADGDAALASQVTALQTTVSGNTASINVLSESIDGIEARWAVTINNNGYVAGAELISGANQLSTWTFLSNVFRIVHPTVPGQTITPFQTGIVNGVSTIGFTGQVMIDGSMHGRSITAGSINADRLNVTQLSAITGNIGTVTAGEIRNPAGTLKFDLPNMKLYRTDGTMTIDLANKIIDITF